MALLDSETLHVQGYFEETKLARIHVGDPVNVRLMGSNHTLRGRVESIAAGIEDRDRSAGATLLANVNPTFNWVRLAQRIPVRIALDGVERNELVAGATATVEVLESALRGSPNVTLGQLSAPRRVGCRAVRATFGSSLSCG
jgi:multidrug resistance efflux pump